MTEFRCRNCKRLLFKVKYLGIIQIMCTRCKKLNEIECKPSFNK